MHEGNERKMNIFSLHNWECLCNVYSTCLKEDEGNGDCAKALNEFVSQNKNKLNNNDVN